MTECVSNYEPIYFPITLAMTAIFDHLKNVGLTENQSTTYLALAKMGEAKAGELIKKTGLHRNIVYTALEELREKGLVALSRVKGVALYKMLPPARLLADAQERERAAKLAIDELRLLSRHTNDQEIIVYEGIDEFRRHVARSYSLAKPGDTLRYLGTSPHWHTIAGPSVENEVIAIQKAKKVKARGIAKEHFPAIQSYAKRTKGLTEIRTNTLVSSDTNNIEILGDRICIQSFVEPYFVVEIVNKELATNYQNYFDFLWSKSKK